MKNLILIFLVTSIATVAQATAPAVVEEVFCGEMDPFVVGDTCVVFIKDANANRIGLVYDFDAFLNEYSNPDDLVGKSVLARDCSRIDSSEKIAVLKDYDSKAFFLECQTLEVSR